MALLSRRIIGLHLERERLYYICARKGVSGLSLHSAVPGMEPCGSIEGGDGAGLRRFLETLSNGIRYEIVLTLPRGFFFVREMALPPMLPHEAWIAVRNSLSVYCHLPLEELYHDFHLSPTGKGGFHALLYYAPRRDIDRILAVFSETGKRRLLKGVFPFSFALYPWLDLQGYSLPLSLVLPSQEGIRELAVYGEKGPVYSASWPGSAGMDSCRSALAAAGARVEGETGKLYFLDRGSEQALPPPPGKRFRGMPLPAENPAVAAAAGRLFRKKQVSIDGRPAKIRQFRPWQVLVPVAFLLLCLLGVLTYRSSADVSKRAEQVRGMERALQALEKKRAPLETDLKVLKKSSQFFSDISEYISGKPQLYRVLNEIARLMPSGTWFSNFMYRSEKVTLTGVSEDALNVLKSLRSSKLFKQVKLVGSVRRLRPGQERFRITIELQKENGAEAGTDHTAEESAPKNVLRR